MAVRNVEWDGFVFRSQTEARTAILFSQLGLEFLYENETYMLAHGKRRFGYLPDFELHHGINRFVEIKNMGSTPPTLEECRKAALLAEQNAYGWPVTILFGPVALSSSHHGSGRTYWPNGDITMPDLLTECPSCKKVEFCTDRKLCHLQCVCEQPYPSATNHRSTRMIQAFKYAKQYRFWG